MKKTVFLCLLLCVLLLSGCGSQTAQNQAEPTPEAKRTISAAPDPAAADHFTATLYFRYQDTDLLMQESSELTILPNEPREKALVNALVSGSKTGGEALFPPGVEVLSTQVNNGIVYVTFNEALYNRYENESDQDPNGENALRRRLAMDALTATLTESGEYHAVQVLVRAESQVGSSMRLKNSYFLTGNDLPCDPLLRSEEHLMTPANVAAAILRAWQQRSFDTLYPLLSSQEDYQLRPSQALFSETFAQSEMLLAYSLTPGSIAPDGQHAVVCVNMTLRRADGSERVVTAWPLRLMREACTWRVSVSTLSSLMQMNGD
ncbi:MAG: GerMN domain-containing protein [Clostridia bacterium]|nr:GerMN domain-containing protein [Clostridia bacterium]